MLSRSTVCRESASDVARASRHGTWSESGVDLPPQYRRYIALPDGRLPHRGGSRVGARENRRQSRNPILCYG
jgi:hypothetical protein